MYAARQACSATAYTVSNPVLAPFATVAIRFQVRASDPTIGMPFVAYHTNEDGLRWIYSMLPWFFRKLLFPHFAKKRAAVRKPHRRSLAPWPA